MMTGRQDGFTIIEVVLFLAISGALFVIAASYMSGTIRAVRFQDGVKAVESYVEKQFTEVQTNAIARPQIPAGKSLHCSLDPTYKYTVFTLPLTTSGNGASDTCIVLGVALYFNSDRIEVYPVIGTDKVSSAQKLPNALASTRPTLYDGEVGDSSVTSGPAQVYELPWQSYWTNSTEPGIYMNGVLTRFNTLAILRAPDSETINTYAMTPTYSGGLVINSSRGDLHAATTTSSSINQQAIICSRAESSGIMRGALILDGAGGGTNNFSISNISSRIVPSSEVIVGGMNCA